ncbi:TonB-dependent receptor [Mucilaginibacter pallidiroseus]|uniref:TonB-dependent receptor n=1 Tax=Mucilaginibacter pallidiroseus TaxID=2599295 RepID=A0A563UI83_9SPHI|nr:carboxypeptidase regulatory-like domain-containing protein [Mucilaginibacter pallidiroseus]TWR31026.1 TonB-dependent receptor [Mucilaginibacter pallidiroseus]
MRKHLLLSIMFLFITAVTFAQVTSSSMSGTIKDAKGETLIGATVRATHGPSGTNYAIATNNDGRFSIANMRVGGPYTVTVSYIGYQPQTFSNVTLSLGQTYQLNVTLQNSGQLAEVVVTGNTSRLMNSSRDGASTNINTREIATLPTVGRNINELTRMTPQASSNSTGAIAGGNYRQNNITIDGSNFNNQFGIGSNLPANGAPISLDALEEISVNIAPFDVKQSGFIGTAVNAVTRAGTNDVSGSVYTYWRNQNQQGNKVGDNTPFTKQRFQQNQTGFRVGGPIIKNKLFLFLNGEFSKTTSPGQQFTASTPENPFTVGNTTNVKRPSASDLNMISDYLRTTYGYETGPYQGYDFISKNNKLLARLDWNINDNNRLNIRYNQVESNSPSFVSTSRSPLAAFSQTRTSQYGMQFANSNYYQDQNLYSIAAELNSNFFLFGKKVSNTLRGSYDHQNDPRSSDSEVFPFVDILQSDGSGTTLPYTSFGYEPFTYGNLRDVKTTSIYDYVTWNSGIHNFTVGGQAEFSKVTNGFQRFGTGYYTFASWNDFVTGQKPVDYAITYPLSPGYTQQFPMFKFAQYSLYGQDDIDFGNFRLSPGIRFDLPTYPGVSEIRTHPLVEALTFDGGRRINTGKLPGSRIMVSPRLGFNWDVKGDHSLQIRGGSGIFTGTIPFVWIVSQAGDSGLLQFTQTYIGQNNTPGPFNPDPKAYLPATPPAAGTSIPSAISVMDENLKFPQTWKSNLAVDARLPWGIIGTLEGLYNKDINTVRGINANLVNPQTLNSTSPDHRYFYPAANAAKFINPLTSAGTVNGTGTNAFNAIVLTNGGKGYYWNLTAKLQKTFASGFSGMIAYSKSQAKNQFDGSGDQLLNTWSLTYQNNGNSNNPELSYANYVVPDRLIASVSYRKEYLKHLATTVSVFYEGSTQGRFSYGYTADFNRDGQTNDLIYIPKNPSEITFVPLTVGTGATAVTYTPQQQSDAFFAYIAQDKYLSKNMGKYAERNGAKYPWRNQFDFKLIQDIFTNVGGKRNTLQFTMDIFNVGNLISKKSGIQRFVNTPNILVPTNAALVSNTVPPTFRLATYRNQLISSTFSDDVSLNSTYYMQFGLRYIFN